MLPLFEVWGQGAVTSRAHAHGRGIKVGDVVKFKLPVTEDEAIKRVMGMPGDFVLAGSPDRGGEGDMIQVRFSFPPHSELLVGGGCAVVSLMLRRRRAQGWKAYVRESSLRLS